MVTNGWTSTQGQGFTRWLPREYYKPTSLGRRELSHALFEHALLQLRLHLGFSNPRARGPAREARAGAESANSRGKTHRCLGNRVAHAEDGGAECCAEGQCNPIFSGGCWALREGQGRLTQVNFGPESCLFYRDAAFPGLRSRRAGGTLRVLDGTSSLRRRNISKELSDGAFPSPSHPLEAGDRHLPWRMVAFGATTWPAVHPAPLPRVSFLSLSGFTCLLEDTSRGRKSTRGDLFFR